MADEKNRKSRGTELAHAGRRKEWTFGIVNPPVFRASTVIFDSVADMRKAGAAPHQIMSYGRRGTPTSFALADALTEISGGAGTVLYSSGLAAITGTLLSFLSSGDHVFLSDTVYEPTRSFADSTLKRFGVDVEYFDPMIGAGIRGHLKPNTRVVFLESPGSVTMEVQDIPAISAAAHDAGAIVIMDNTWATPLLFDAFAHGVDVSVIAATKYIGGHADAMLGAATANERTIDQLRRNSGLLGAGAAPDDVYLGLRGLRTLELRLRQHEKSALHVAQWLQTRDEVDHVRHPALPTCPGHDCFNRDFAGSSGLFSFVLKDNQEAPITAFLEGMTHFKMGFSWGGFESLVMAYRNLKHIRTASGWNHGAVIRLHIGLEDPEALIEDLEAAFARYNAAK